MYPREQSNKIGDNVQYGVAATPFLQVLWILDHIFQLTEDLTPPVCIPSLVESIHNKPSPNSVSVINHNPPFADSIPGHPILIHGHRRSPRHTAYCKNLTPIEPHVLSGSDLVSLPIKASPRLFRISCTGRVPTLDAGVF